MATFDVAVIGVGGMGSAACWHLSRRGLSVLGLDQFSIPNHRGSSHGATRILRLGLHESTKYVPLVQRAAELWNEVGALVGQRIFHRVGSLDMALPESPIFRGSLQACVDCDIDHEVLSARELHERFPAISPTPGMQGVYQRGSGFVLPEAAITAQVELAIDAGAEIHGCERVEGWDKEGGEFIIRTDRGTYRARQILITAGAWIGKLLTVAQVPVTAERTVLGWFAPKADPTSFNKERLPVWIVDSPTTGHFYGFPRFGVPGFKLGRLREQPSTAIDPDLPREEATGEDEEDMRTFIRECFPKADGPLLAMETCFFENTPDRAPIIDRLPEDENIWVVGGFSGHGFKYASVMGEIAADLLTKGESAYHLEPFALGRFST